MFFAWVVIRYLLRLVDSDITLTLAWLILFTAPYNVHIYHPNSYLP